MSSSGFKFSSSKARSTGLKISALHEAEDAMQVFLSSKHGNPWLGFPTVKSVINSAQIVIIADAKSVILKIKIFLRINKIGGLWCVQPFL